MQISNSCSHRLFLNFPREFRYCNNSEFEFPSWINKPLFGAKAIVSKSPFMAVFATLNKEHCLWIWSAFLDTSVVCERRRISGCRLYPLTERSDSRKYVCFCRLHNQLHFKEKGQLWRQTCSWRKDVVALSSVAWAGCENPFTNIELEKDTLSLKTCLLQLTHRHE